MYDCIWTLSQVELKNRSFKKHFNKQKITFKKFIIFYVKNIQWNEQQVQICNRIDWYENIDQNRSDTGIGGLWLY